MTLRRLAPLFLLLGLVPHCGGSSAGSPSASTPEPVCEAGRQLECSCPGGAKGSQRCNNTGTSFDICACGGSGMTAGSSTGGAQPAGTSSGTGGVGGGGSSGGNGNSSGGAAGDAGSPSVDPVAGNAAGGVGTDEADDDPCPATTIKNCSDTCDSQTQCTVMRCNGGLEAQRINIEPFTAGDEIVVRTPSHPGDQDCNACNEGYSSLANITLQSTPFTVELMYEVDPPWHVVPVDTGTFNPMLCGNAQCLVRNAGLAVGVATNDPNAPARNVRISFAPVRGCLPQ